MILVIEGVSFGACQGLWEPEEVCTWLELHHARDGERRLLVSAQVSVTWEVTRLLVSVKTWIRGVCQHIDTTEKIRLSLAHSFISSTYFHPNLHALDLRDHNLALPCLVSYLC